MLGRTMARLTSLKTAVKTAVLVFFIVQMVFAIKKFSDKPAMLSTGINH